LVQTDLSARGIRVAIRQLEMGAFLSRARAVTKDFDLLVTGIPGDFALAYLGAMYDSRQHGGALDYGEYHSRELDALLSTARQAPPDRQATAWRRVQELLAREVPSAWIYHSRGLQGVAARVQGVTFDLRGELASLHGWRVSSK
jgi:peptide/nickel transport system substrate-binding protein